MNSEPVNVGKRSKIFVDHGSNRQLYLFASRTNSSARRGSDNNRNILIGHAVWADRSNLSKAHAMRETLRNASARFSTVCQLFGNMDHKAGLCNMMPTCLKKKSSSAPTAISLSR